MSELILLLLTCFAFTSITLFGLTSYIIFINIRLKVFVWYSIYCFLLAFYISFKFIPYYDETYLYDSGLNWFIQTLFYNAYLRFGLYYIEYSKISQNNARRIFKSQKIVLALSLLAFVFQMLNIIKILDFFIYIFLPYLVLTTLFIFVDSLRKVNRYLKYFLMGTLSYTVLAGMAFYLTFNGSESPYIQPITYFFVAVNIETFIFSVGLGQKIKHIYTNKIIYEKEVNKLLQIENKNKELLLNVSELNNTVLRNQMNSHFVFNVLNSIKLFMMENDSKKAILYLSKFAKFMRKVLDANFYEDVSLSEELQAIDLYLSIERMRFDYNFSYHIDVDSEVDLHSRRLPAFILQPFIENVLWHGFVKKEGSKHLSIQVTKDLKIIVEDNGIGRKAASEHNNQVKKHKSYGLQIIQKRLQFFNEKHHKNIRFDITDLKTGTRVTLSLI